MLNISYADNCREKCRRMAGILCYNLVAPQIPLKLNEQSNLFKLYMADVGLLCASCMGNIAQEDSITYLPWYMILFIKKDEIQQNTIFEVPLNGI